MAMGAAVLMASALAMMAVMVSGYVIMAGIFLTAILAGVGMFVQASMNALANRLESSSDAQVIPWTESPAATTLGTKAQASSEKAA